jgi:LPXTG-site transpeptidase (sortase) family protein
MKKVLFSKKDLLLMVLGAILLVGGFFGVLMIFKLGPDINMAQAAAPTEIQVVPSPLALDPPATATPLPDTSNESSPSGATVEKVAFPSLALGKYDVHADPASGLETPLIPDRIVIPSVGIDAKVMIADFNSTNIDGETFGQWLAPNELAAGWQPDSALLGQEGNTVINGHHNEYGEVFGNLVNIKIGDNIYVYSQGKKFSFIVSNYMILQERFVSTAIRLQNERWLSPSNDVRLTLVTCWPKISNTHRLIIVARPVDLGSGT